MLQDTPVVLLSCSPATFSSRHVDNRTCVLQDTPSVGDRNEHVSGSHSCPRARSATHMFCSHKNEAVAAIVLYYVCWFNSFIVPVLSFYVALWQ